MQIEPDGHGAQTSVPHRLWLNLTLKTADGKEGLIFVNPGPNRLTSPSIPQHGQPRAEPPIQCLVLTFINLLNSGLFPSSYHHSKLINTGTLSQNTSSNSVSTCKSVRGERRCDHWDGKEAVPSLLCRGVWQRWTPWAHREPWGTCRFVSLCCEACWAST